METNQKKKSFWRTKWGIILLLFIWPYVLLFLLFKWIFKRNWNPIAKIGTVIGIILFLFIIGASSQQQNNASVLSSQTKISQVQKTNITLPKITVVPTATPSAAPTITPKPTSVSTKSQYIAPTVIVQPTTPADSNNSTGLSNDNYYTNSNGNQVHSPAYSNNGSVPAGATAQCTDGTYSFSQHRSGTCSHHGGVLTWY